MTSGPSNAATSASAELSSAGASEPSTSDVSCAVSVGRWGFQAAVRYGLVRRRTGVVASARRNRREHGTDEFSALRVGTALHSSESSKRSSTLGPRNVSYVQRSETTAEA